MAAVRALLVPRVALPPAFSPRMARPLYAAACITARPRIVHQPATRYVHVGGLGLRSAANSDSPNSKNSKNNNGGDEENDKLPEGMGARLKHMQQKYGRTALVVFLALDGLSLATCYTLVRSGLDVQALLTAVHFDPSSWGFGEHGSTFIIAYAVHKVCVFCFYYY
jgi:hypothetical protein